MPFEDLAHINRLNLGKRAIAKPGLKPQIGILACVSVVERFD
jgi:hypothetical protein